VSVRCRSAAIKQSSQNHDKMHSSVTYAVSEICENDSVDLFIDKLAIIVVKLVVKFAAGVF